MLLEERGKLNVGDPLNPDAPAAWDKITLYNLLTHSSGIPNFTSFPDYGATEALPSPAEKTVLHSGYDSNSEVIARRASGYAPGAVGLW